MKEELGMKEKTQQGKLNHETLDTKSSTLSCKIASNIILKLILTPRMEDHVLVYTTTRTVHSLCTYTYSSITAHLQLKHCALTVHPRLVVVLCAPWSPAGPRKSLDTRCVLLFVGALLSWRPVLANRRIPGVIGGGFVCSVVAGGTQNIVGY